MSSESVFGRKHKMIDEQKAQFQQNKEMLLKNMKAIGKGASPEFQKTLEEIYRAWESGELHRQSRK